MSNRLNTPINDEHAALMARRDAALVNKTGTYSCAQQRLTDYMTSLLRRTTKEKDDGRTNAR